MCPDAQHLREATLEGKNWGIDDLALAEGQNTVLVRSYYWLDFHGNDNHTIDRTIAVVCDTTAPIANITRPPDGRLVGSNQVDID